MRRALAGLLFVFAWVYQVASVAHAQTYTAKSVDIPIPSGHSEMLAPYFQGRLFQTGPYNRRYPSAGHSMQFMAFRNPATSDVFYVQTLDPDGQVIDWTIDGSANAYTLHLTVYTQTGAFPNDFYYTDTLTAATQVEFYRKVARVYKAWAIDQKWAKRKFSGMDTMATMAMGPDLNSSTVNVSIPEYIDRFAGQNTGCWIKYWRGWWPGYQIDTAVPHYQLQDPVNGRTALAALNAKNCAPFPYMNGLLWDSELVYTPGAVAGSHQDRMNQIWLADPAARYDAADMVKDEFGQVVANGSTSKRFVCQSAPRWKTNFIASSRTIASDRWKGIYFDQAAFEKPRLCYDPNHSHDPGDPLVWQNGIRDVLTTLKTDPQTKDLMIITEGNAEIYMDLVDGFVSYAGTADLDTSSPLNLQVPLFREVYGELARYFGWQVLSSGATAAGMTPNIFRSAARKAADFGSLFASPYFLGSDAGGEPNKVQAVIATDPQYSSIVDLLKKPHYKKVYERGGGAVNWAKSGSAPGPVGAVDSETGTAAVSFGLTDLNSGYNELVIKESDMFQLSWDMKMSGSYFIRVSVTATDSSSYDLIYNEQARNFRQTSGANLQIGLGAQTTDGKWQTVRRDLAADLYEGAGKTLSDIVSFRVYGTGLVDNITASNAPQALEDGTGASNWDASITGLSASSAVDADTGSAAVRLTGIVNRDDSKYFKLDIHDSQRFELAWDFKTSMNYYVVVTVGGDDGLYYNLLYDQNARDFRQTVSGTVKLGLGPDTKDGQWHSFRRNLADDLFEGTGRSIVSVAEMRVYATGSIDNVALWGNGLRTSGR